MFRTGGQVVRFAADQATPARRRLSPLERAARSAAHRFRRDEEGSVLVTFALMFVVLLGFAAMVTDVGTLYWNRRMLQNAVDGAALAGAAYLPNTTGQATTTAGTYAASNGVTNAELTAGGGAVVGTTFNSNDTLTVSVQRLDNFGLRYVIGGGDTNVVATAAAIVTALAPSGIWPIAVQQSADCSNGCTVKFGAGGSYTGNFGFLALGGNGASTVDDNIKNRYSGAIPTPTSSSGTTPVWSWNISTEPGNVESATQDGFGTLLSWDAGKTCNGGRMSCSALYTTPPADGYNYNPQTSDGTICVADTRCPRVGIVPVISQDWSSLGGRSTITVVSFQCYYVQDMNPNGNGRGHTSLTGKSLGFCYAGGGSGTSAMYNVPLNSTGSYGVVLWR